jgi:hypothetical protein
MQIPDPQSAHVLSLVAELAPSQRPQFVAVEPLPWAEELACIDVVDRCVSENGGRQVLGWGLWEWPGVLLEAEFHAIWEKPDGSVTDPTPKRGPVQKILFLPDPEARVVAFQKDNVRRPLAKRKEILDFIEINERFFQARNTDPNSSTFVQTKYLDFLDAERMQRFHRLVVRFGPPPRFGTVVGAAA